MGIERRKEIDKTTTIQRAEDADKFANKMKQLHQFLREEMTYVQAIQEDYANKNESPHQIIKLEITYSQTTIEKPRLQDLWPLTRGQNNQHLFLPAITPFRFQCLPCFLHE